MDNLRFFSYVILTLIVRIIHSPGASTHFRSRIKIIGSLFIFCFVSTLLTLVILRSDYCTCDSLSTKDWREVIGDPCDGVCILGSGIVMMVAALFWLVTAVATFKIGVQPTEIMENGQRRPTVFRLLETPLPPKFSVLCSRCSEC
jgi:hypothetical protein